MAGFNYTCANCGISIWRYKRSTRSFQVCSRRCHAVVFRRTRTKLLSERFWSKVAKTETCWLWTGALYGRYHYGKMGAEPERKATLSAHRVSWELHYGMVPDGMCVLHKCDVPKCVNPDHLFLGTRKDNSLDMVAKKRSPHGETNGAAKLTEGQVKVIRSSVLIGRIIAAEFGVSESLISMIRRREVWKNVI